MDNYGRIPLAFEANHGQTDPLVKFVSRGPGYGLFLTANEAVLTLRRAANRELSSLREKALRTGEESVVFRMTVVGANATGTKIYGYDKLPSKSNYFIGNNPSKWCTNIQQYAKVRYADLYPAWTWCITAISGN